MQLTLIIAACLVAPGAGSAAGVTPVQKVVQMLTEMLEKAKKEKDEEQIQFSAYNQFCKDTTAEKQKSIAEANQLLESLAADIEKYQAEADMLAKQILVHNEDVSVFTRDIKAANKVRDIEKNDYRTIHKDYTESVDALEMAINVLKKQARDRKQTGAALTQVTASYLIPKESKRVIEAFLAEDPEVGTDYMAPEANAYEFQSQGIVDMLQKLKEKFEDERSVVEKEETTSRNAYTMLMQDLNAQIEAANKASQFATLEKAKKFQASEKAQGDITDTKATRDDDSKYLTELTATCEQKASDFGNRQTLRAEEVTALEKAIEILSSEAVAGAADKHLPALIQKATGASFAQIRSQVQSPNQERVAMYLQDQAKRLNSRILSALAVHVADDPFKKVKKMIQDLLTRLMEEATEEAEHKGWCDHELSTNEQTRQEKTQVVETLSSEVDELEASIAKLLHQVTELTAQVAQIEADVLKATQMREDEKAKNADTVNDSQEAQQAVAQALAVLKEFYAKAGEATALSQQPEIFDGSFQGNQAASGGVVGMLEVIQTDFARLEAETTASEEKSTAEYKDFMTNSAVSKATKGKDIEHKTSQRQSLEQSLQERKTDLSATQKELDAAMAYYEKLKPSCVDSGVSYQDRVARRKDELASLEEAWKILNGEDVGQVILGKWYPNEDSAFLAMPRGN